MARFVLRFRGRGPRPADLAERLSALPGTTVLEDGGRMLLVEAPEELLRDALAGENCLIAPERSYPLPDPRPRVRRAGR